MVSREDLQRLSAACDAAMAALQAAQHHRDTDAGNVAFWAAAWRKEGFSLGSAHAERVRSALDVYERHQERVDKALEAHEAAFRAWDEAEKAARHG